MKRILIICAIAVGHAVGTFALLLYMLHAGSARFDSGVPATMLERLLTGVGMVLACPIYAPFSLWGGRWAGRLFPGLLGYVPLFCNGLVWGWMLCWLWGRRIKQKIAVVASHPARP